MDTFYYFLESVPECVGTIALCLALAQTPLRWRRIFIGGVIFSLLTFGIRALPVTFGLHLPICIFLIFFALIKMTDLSPSRTIMAVFASFFIVALLEYVVSTVFFALTHMDPNQALANEPLWTGVGITQDAILIIISLVIPHFFKPTKGIWIR